MKQLETKEFKDISKDNIIKTINYLFKNNYDFALTTDVKHLTFMPELPDNISSSFNDIILFVITGYSFESSKLDDEYFSFEAGFGEENFGSVVSIPLLAINNIFLEEVPILINQTTPNEVKTDKESKKLSSMEALLNNPENQKLLKKRKD